MHHAEGGVTFRDGLHHNAHRAHVEQLFEGKTLELHFSPDTVDMFGTAVDARRDARLGQLAVK